MGLGFGDASGGITPPLRFKYTYDILSLGFRVKLLHRSRFSSKGWFLPSTLHPTRPRSLYIVVAFLVFIFRGVFSGDKCSKVISQEAIRRPPAAAATISEKFALQKDLL